MFLLFLTSADLGYANQGSSQEPPFYLPTNGDICPDCEGTYSPNVYNSYLEDFFHSELNRNYSIQEITASVEHLVSKELSDVAVFMRMADENPETDFTQINNKIEGFKVLSTVLANHYGSWTQKTLKHALESGIKVCAFNASGDLCSREEYENKECNANCRILSLNDIINFTSNKRIVSELQTALLTPSVIAEKLASKTGCKESAERIANQSRNTEEFCGILKSKKIVDAFMSGKVLAYVAFDDYSYACKKVGLFFQRNSKTHRMEPDPDRSFLVYPDGHREDLSESQVRKIINHIYHQ
ncbi:MAG: hypothetical protein ACXVCY_08715 [Pseudobdellovibrionaceae bacterium]